jgi:hypothetical protein
MVSSWITSNKIRDQTGKIFSENYEIELSMAKIKT